VAPFGTHETEILFRLPVLLRGEARRRPSAADPAARGNATRRPLPRDGAPSEPRE
jgi:hypothetical protein